MSLKTDRFIQTMLYTSLFYDSKPDEKPVDGFKIYEDGTMSYRANNGLLREVEVVENHPGILSVSIFDVKSNEPYRSLNMRYEKSYCTHCHADTIHALNEGRFYCTECGTYST